MARFAVKTPTHHTTWDRMLEVWQAADDIDLFESAWNFDHFYPLRATPMGPVSRRGSPCPHWRQATKRIRWEPWSTACPSAIRRPGVDGVVARRRLGRSPRDRSRCRLVPVEVDAYGLDLGTVNEGWRGSRRAPRSSTVTERTRTSTAVSSTSAMHGTSPNPFSNLAHRL